MVLDSAMILVSAVGRLPLWLALGVAGVLLGRMKAMAFWQLCLALLLAFLVADVFLKPVVHSTRPFDAAAPSRVVGPRPSGYSFPSGHAASSFAAASALSRGWPGGTIAWFALAVLISYSRLYLGVHYPVDVAGGILIGLACGYFVVAGTRWHTHWS